MTENDSPQATTDPDTPKPKRSRWRWFGRLAVSLLVALLAAVAIMGTATIDPAAASRKAAPWSLTDDAWPPREPPVAPRLTRRGDVPRDLGAYGHCQVFDFGPDTLDPAAANYMLVSKCEGGIKGSFWGFDGPGWDFTGIEVQCDGQNLLFAQVAPAVQRPVGTLLYLGSIDILSHGERAALRVARRRGWNVIACTVGLDAFAPTRIPVSDEGSDHLAFRIDYHLSDRAYAMESLLAHLQAEQPELLVGPRVLVGMSAGAIALPTVAAKVGPVDAAVLIGGGENVARILADSPLFRQNIELTRLHVDKTDPKNFVMSYVACTDTAKLHGFAERVLPKAKLDPHHTAAALSGTPVLMLHAQHDQIVPAASGEALYESLGRPERWRYRTGHLGLTLLTPWKIGGVLDWLAEQTLNKAAASR